MGNYISSPVELDTNNSNIINKSNLDSNSGFKSIFFIDKYNLIPSYPGLEYKTIDNTNLKRKFNTDEDLPAYVDLRNNFPQIINMDNLPFNPIISVVYLLHYQLLRNGLPVFPPSSMFIYKNIRFYKNVKSLMSLEVIFNSIKENGICSENEFSTSVNNLENNIPSKVIEKSTAFKFIDVYRVEQNLETIKTLIKNKYPILIGFTMYYDVNNIDNFMWIPDIEIDKKLGGLSGVLVGYIEERKMFIMATTFGEQFGSSGYIMIPYDYVLNKNLTFELWTLDFIKDRVEGYINQRKEMINLENNKLEKKTNENVYKRDNFNSLFK